MQETYEVRRISKERLAALRKAGGVGSAILVENFAGLLIVEPSDSHLGDGETLAPETADYELRPVWCLGAKTRLREARERLGLDATAGERQLAAAL